MFFRGDGSPKFLFHFRPEFRRNDRGQKPADSKSEVVQATQQVMHKYTARFDDSEKILGPGLNQFFASDIIERTVFYRPLNSQPGDFFFSRAHLEHDRLPSPLH